MEHETWRIEDRAGYKVQGAGYKVQGAGYKVQGAGCLMHGELPSASADGNKCLSYWELGAGNWGLETGDWELEAGGIKQRAEC